MSELEEFINPEPPVQAEMLPPGAARAKVLAWDFYNKVFQPNCAWDPGDRAYIWTGSIMVDVAEFFGISAVYTSNIMRELYRMRCLVRIRKGGGKGGLTALAVQHPPTEGLWATEQISSNAATSSKSAADDQRIRDHEKRISQLESSMQAVLNVLHDKEEG
jgi:hypothetical protein